MAKKNDKYEESFEEIDENFEENQSFYTIKQKQTYINSEKTRLTKIFKDVSSEKKKLVNPLINELAFMFAELKDLKEQIKRDGSVEKYKNGANQYGKKKSAAVDVYNTMIKNYTSAYKQISDFLPKNDVPIDDGFDEF